VKTFVVGLHDSLFSASRLRLFFPEIPTCGPGGDLVPSVSDKVPFFFFLFHYDVESRDKDYRAVCSLWRSYVTESLFCPHDVSLTETGSVGSSYRLDSDHTRGVPSQHSSPFSFLWNGELIES